MKFTIKYTDVHNLNVSYEGEVDIHLSEEEIAAIAGNYRDTLEEMDCLDDEDPLETDMLETYNDVVFGACPALEERFRAALEPDLKDDEDFANGYYFGGTDSWWEKNDAGEELAVPVFYFQGLPEEIKDRTRELL